MNDNKKIKAQLIAELKELRKLNAELDAEKAERKKAEEQIKYSLREKEILLQEIHHRVKNNLQIISSLLTLKSKNIKDKKVAELIFEIKNSIRTMVKIHERLYQSENLSNINFKDYINEIANDLVLAYYPNNKDTVSINYNIEDISLRINTAIPCGLVLNELISNSLKHAFPGNRKGQINIDMRSVNNNYECIVMDNGIGISKDFDVAKIKTIGLYLATGIIEKQLCGKIDFKRSSGTIVKITFPQRS